MARIGFSQGVYRGEGGGSYGGIGDICICYDAVVIVENMRNCCCFVKLINEAHI